MVYTESQPLNHSTGVASSMHDLDTPPFKCGQWSQMLKRPLHRVATHWEVNEYRVSNLIYETITHAVYSADQ